jgi:hypothetical protein
VTSATAIDAETGWTGTIRSSPHARGIERARMRAAALCMLDGERRLHVH